MVAHYFETVENTVTGKPVANASVSVLTAPSADGGTELTIYSDEGLTTQADNPLLTDNTGYFEFYTNQDECCLEIAYGGTTRRVIENVQLIGASVSTDLTALQVRMDAVEAALAGNTTSNVKPTESMVIACSDEVTPLSTGTAKVTFRMPYPFTLTAITASLTEAQTSGSILTVDANEGGTSILSTKLTVDNGEKTSTTAATAVVISDSSLADDAEITIDIDQVGDGTAKGLKVVFIGHRT